MRRHWSVLGVWLCLFSGCRARQEQGQAPPEVNTAGQVSSATVCANALGEFRHADLQGVLSTRVGDYCVDPNSAPRAYGQEGEGDMDDVCTELFNGECELYKSYGLLRVTTARYVASNGSSALVSANVSRFGGPEGALAFFSRRVLGDQDPKQVSLRPIEAMPYAALGTGVAYAQSGPLVVELVYVNENEAPETIRAVSAALLPRFLSTLASRQNVQPQVVNLLPREHRVPFGVALEPKNAFGVSGLGAAATGYYEEGGKRYRVTVSHNVDEASAKDVYAGARRLPGWRALKDVPYDAFEVRQVSEEEGPVVWWLVGKQGHRVVAVTDEPWALRETTPNEQERVSLDRDAKFEVLERVLRAK
jgi:hypothetical protein